MSYGCLGKSIPRLHFQYLRFNYINVIRQLIIFNYINMYYTF